MTRPTARITPKSWPRSKPISMTTRLRRRTWNSSTSRTPQIIAESLREIQRFQREFEAVKAKVAISRSLEGLAGMMKSSITELQGMMGGELGQSMQQLRQSAASGEGQMRATLDLAKEMGSGVSRQQEARKLRGAALFQEYKKKMGMVQPEAAAVAKPPTAQPERQKISEK